MEGDHSKRPPLPILAATPTPFCGPLFPKAIGQVPGRSRCHLRMQVSKENSIKLHRGKIFLCLAVLLGPAWGPCSRCKESLHLHTCACHSVRCLPLSGMLTWPPQVTCNPSWLNRDSSEELTLKTGLGIQLRGSGMLLSLLSSPTHFPVSSGTTHPTRVASLFPRDPGGDSRRPSGQADHHGDAAQATRGPGKLSAWSLCWAATCSPSTPSKGTF